MNGLLAKLGITSPMPNISRHCASAFWLCLIAVAFVLSTSSANRDIDVMRATFVIGGPLLIIATGRSVIEIGQWSRRRLKEGQRSPGGVLAGLTVLASVGLGVLVVLVVNMIDNTLGNRYGRDTGPFSVDTGCAFRLMFVIGSLLLFAAAGRYVVGIGQLSRRQFKDGRRLLGGASALKAVLMSGGLVMLGWVIVVFIGFVLFYRQ